MGTITTPPGIQVDGMHLVAPGGQLRDVADDQRFRWARDRHEGFQIGQYLNMPPMFFTRDRHPMFLVDNYRGVPAFLIGGGPSFADVDKSKLILPGILTMAMNNSVKTFRPNLWACVDNPQNFIKSTWLDPRIQKFVPLCHAEKRIFDNEAWEEMKIKVGDCPNVIYYIRNEHFKHDQYLFEDSINWGCHGDMTCSCGFKGCRSVMLAAVRILYLLGIRTIYLLGTDFKMTPEQKYHFSQDRSKGSIKNNNNTYKALNARFTALNPIFLKHGLRVFNCVPDSGLVAFPHMDYDDAIKDAQRLMPKDIEHERTEGLYDRRANIEKAEKERKKKEEQAKKEKEKGKEEKPRFASPVVANKQVDTLKAFVESMKRG
jgi:hypothetical protein